MGKVSAANIWRKYFFFVFYYLFARKFCVSSEEWWKLFFIWQFFFGNTDDEFLTWLEPFCTSLKVHDFLLSSVHSDQLLINIKQELKKKLIKKAFNSARNNKTVENCHFLFSFITILNNTLLFNSLQKFLTKWQKK